MRVFINSNEEQRKELASKFVNPEKVVFFSDSFLSEEENSDYDVFFILDKKAEDINFEKFGGKPVFINEVISTLYELKVSANVSRLNAWSGFLERDIWEIVTNDESATRKIFDELSQQVIIVKDTPGMVAARVISMIINEAWYALKEKVSTREEIDLAMKLGTNYPFGPFEWGQKIGMDNVYRLLEKLSQTDNRCIPAFDLNDY